MTRSASGPDGMIYAERPRPCQLWAAPGAPRSQSLASGRRRPRQWRRLCLLGGRYDVSPDPVRRPSLSDHYGLDFKDGAKLFRAEVSGIGTAILGLGRRSRGPVIIQTAFQLMSLLRRPVRALRQG
jgi:hypothetical protein